MSNVNKKEGNIKNQFNIEKKERKFTHNKLSFLN